MTTHSHDRASKGLVPQGIGQAVLRGIGQVFFAENAWTGAVVLLALTITSPRLASLAVLGCLVQCLVGWLTGRHEEVRRGLMGYNGALVGAAASLDASTGLHALPWTIVGAAVCVPVHLLLARLLGGRGLGRFALPVLTAPFCLVAGINHLVLSPPAGGSLSGSAEAWPGMGHGLFNGIAEVFLGDGWLVGLVILVGLAINSWRAALWGLGGSGLALVGAWVAGLDHAAASAGLFGYSAVLVAMAIGDTFCAHWTLRRRGLAVVAGVVIAVLLRWFLASTPVPVYTWPFVVATWLVLALAAPRSRA